MYPKVYPNACTKQPCVLAWGGLSFVGLLCIRRRPESKRDYNKAKELLDKAIRTDSSKVNVCSKFEGMFVLCLSVNCYKTRATDLGMDSHTFKINNAGYLLQVSQHYLRTS